MTRLFEIGTGWVKLEFIKPNMFKIGQLIVISSLAKMYTA